MKTFMWRLATVAIVFASIALVITLIQPVHFYAWLGMALIMAFIIAGLLIASKG